MQASDCIPASHQVLTHGGKLLQDGVTIRDAGLRHGADIQLSARLLGGKPVKVKMMTNHLPCGSEVTIDIDESATKNDIKYKLAEVTGVPVEHQKVMLSGINQIVMGDKRTNIGYTTCGSANGVQMAVDAKQS